MPVWKILCIDTSASANEMMQLLLGDLFFLERRVRVLKALSIREAERALETHSDIAVIIIDIEEDKAEGLRFVHEVRNKYNNAKVRIVLRTGYPCILPSKQDILDYMIDGYIPKEIATQTQIEITVMTAIRAYHQIISTEKMLSGLAGSIAHEMRNPLAQIHGNLRLIQEQIPHLNAQPIVAEHIDYAQKVIQSGLQVVDMTMDAIREKPVNPHSFELLSARSLAEESVADYACGGDEYVDRVSIKGEDFKLIAEPVMVKYVLYNLIKNALFYVKAMPDAEIVITLMPAIGEVNCIEVRDTGPGIAAEAIPKLFDSFYTAGKQGGTGLGLSYCKRSMTALGGDIRCCSELDQYTAFILSFPSVSDELLKIVNRKAKAPPAEYRLLSLQGKTVLLVEDDRISRVIGKAMLERQGMHCLEAANGQQALELLAMQHCDLILTDMQMPLMNGLELIKAVKEGEKKAGDAHIPIIVLSSEEGDMVDAAMQLGASGCLMKPVEAGVLMPRLQQLWADSD